MAIIKKKAWPDYYEQVVRGEKKFDMRVADFPVVAGDTLVLEEWNPEIKEYTGRSISKKVGYVGTFPLDAFGQREALEKHGLHVIQFEDDE
ncbi:MAG: hypothetical protein UW32_C0001G0068 [Candidatus Wolfebacteria bacterium GW2011_GWE2_44_13]|uniref:DUF3850 domain-containing protein n=1 Tax=Candidatus Wolfebacteria bacterium GW2011_GWE2_44_13 TaxID=1619017 RepID=A0A0G1H7V9_9BACT|nr:MAG: hypothetical protein UW32_C0001G0068 [Candidatus Wolfebacteria bacterium GW2011_GWE2_44_13]